MKRIQNLAGAKILSRKEQCDVRGGGPGMPGGRLPLSACRMEDGVASCPSGQDCIDGTCVYPNGGGSNGGNSNRPPLPHYEPPFED